MVDKRIRLTLYSDLVFDVHVDHITTIVPRIYEKSRWLSFRKPRLESTKVGATVSFTNGENYDVMETMNQIRETRGALLYLALLSYAAMPLRARRRLLRRYAR